MLCKSPKKLIDADKRASAKAQHRRHIRKKQGFFANALQTTEKIEDALSDRRLLLFSTLLSHSPKRGFSPTLCKPQKKLKECRSITLFALHNIAAAFAEAGQSVDAKNTFSNALRSAEQIEAANDTALPPYAKSPSHSLKQGIA